MEIITVSAAAAITTAAATNSQRIILKITGFVPGGGRRTPYRNKERAAKIKNGRCDVWDASVTADVFG